MPIYDIFATKEPEPTLDGESEVLSSGKDRFFSSLTARILFFLLLVADLCWGFFAFCMVLITGPLNLLTGRKIGLLKRMSRKYWIALKRSGICGVSLFISLFSPALGIMIACTYFLMYDKSGIEEVVPSSLQSQFKEFLPKE